MPPKREPPRGGGGGGGGGPSDAGGTPGRWIVFGILLLSVAGVLALALNAPWSESRRDAPPGVSLGGDDPSSSPPSAARLEGAPSPSRGTVSLPAAPTEDPLEPLATGAGDDLVRAAAGLRRRLREDAAFLEQMLARLLDPELDGETRSRLAFVLGTLDAPGVAAALLTSIQAFGGEAAYLRAALLALGAQQEPAEEDDIFAMGDRPHGVVGPGGLGITIRRELTDPAVKALLLAHLDHAEESARYAAARSLDASVASSDVRTGLQSALRQEESDGVAARLAEPLSRWAAGARRGTERDALLDLLVLQAVQPDLDETRFRLEKDLGRVALPADSRARLFDATAPSAPLAVRLFAITTLSGAAERVDADAQGRIRERLGELATADGDAGVRDLAARQLGRVPASDGSRAALERAATRDEAWSVRYAALESLARLGDGPHLRRALQTAQEDGEPRVVDLARQIQARLPGR